MIYPGRLESGRVLEVICRSDLHLFQAQGVCGIRHISGSRGSRRSLGPERGSESGEQNEGESSER